MKKLLLLTAVTFSLLPACNRKHGEASSLDRLTTGAASSALSCPGSDARSVTYQVKGHMDNTNIPITGQFHVQPNVTFQPADPENGPSSDSYDIRATIDFELADGTKGTAGNTGGGAFIESDGTLHFYEFSAAVEGSEGPQFFYPDIKGCNFTKQNISTVLANLDKCPSFEMPFLIEAAVGPIQGQTPGRFTEIKKGTSPDHPKPKKVKKPKVRRPKSW